MSIRITHVDAYDIRFPTSRELIGSDAMNPDPDYSAAYVILRTDSPHGLEGHGLVQAIGVDLRSRLRDITLGLGQAHHRARAAKDAALGRNARGDKAHRS